ncbi:MAG: hypothetical protein U0556_10025 [Dehalococcoidia bacterium]
MSASFRQSRAHRRHWRAVCLHIIDGVLLLAIVAVLLLALAAVPVAR